MGQPSRTFYLTCLQCTNAHSVGNSFKLSGALWAAVVHFQNKLKDVVHLFN